MISEDLTDLISRKSLCQFLDGVIDPNFLQRVWVEKDFKPGDFVLDDLVHFLFDDTELAENASACIGTILLSRTEAGCTMLFADAIQELLDKNGRTMKDYEYIRTPEWQNVVRRAKIVHSVICGLEDLE